MAGEQYPHSATRGRIFGQASCVLLRHLTIQEQSQGTTYRQQLGFAGFSAPLVGAPASSEIGQVQFQINTSNSNGGKTMLGELLGENTGKRIVRS